MDTIFSATGDTAYLARLLPVVDASLAFVLSKSDADGLATLIPVGKGHTGGGGDWVDWEKTRLDGRTLQFHFWLIRALRRFAQLHLEFSGTFGSAVTAAAYSSRANALEGTLRRLYWRGDHWLTNLDYADAAAGTVGWLDDVVWSVYHGVANATMGAVLWPRIDADPAKFEGVPLTWTAFPTNHGKCSWFGRLGGGDIMARYKTGQTARALALLESFAGTVVAHGNIYEGYDMNGCGLSKCGCTTAGFGDYLEHCGGLVWTVVEGTFGLDFDSSAGGGGQSAPHFAATIEPRFPTAWVNASLVTAVRGSDLTVRWSSQAGGEALALSVPAGAEPVPIRVLGCGLPAADQVVLVSPGAAQHIACHR